MKPGAGDESPIVLSLGHFEAISDIKRRVIKWIIFILFLFINN